MIKQLNEQYYVRGLCEADIEGPYPLWFEDQEVCAGYLSCRFSRPSNIANEICGPHIAKYN